MPLNCALVDIEKTEPAFDGVWFDGKVGEWASIGQNQVKQLADHMKSAYESHGKKSLSQIPVELIRQREFTWANTD